MKLSHGKDVVKQGIFGSSNLSTNKSLSIFAKGDWNLFLFYVIFFTTT